MIHNFTIKKILLKSITQPRKEISSEHSEHNYLLHLEEKKFRSCSKETLILCWTLPLFKFVSKKTQTEQELTIKNTWSNGKLTMINIYTYFTPILVKKGTNRVFFHHSLFKCRKQRALENTRKNSVKFSVNKIWIYRIYIVKIWSGPLTSRYRYAYRSFIA